MRFRTLRRPKRPPLACEIARRGLTPPERPGGTHDQESPRSDRTPAAKREPHAPPRVDPARALAALGDAWVACRGEGAIDCTWPGMLDELERALATEPGAHLLDVAWGWADEAGWRAGDDRFYHRWLLDVSQALGDAEGEARARARLDHLDRALEPARAKLVRRLAATVRRGLAIEEAETRQELCELLTDAGRYDEAYDHIARAIEIFDEERELDWKAQALARLCILWGRQEDWERSDWAGRQATKIEAALNAPFVGDWDENGPRYDDDPERFEPAPDPVAAAPHHEVTRGPLRLVVSRPAPRPPPRENTFKQKTLTEWAELMRSGDEDEAWSAMVELKEAACRVGAFQPRVAFREASTGLAKLLESPNEHLREVVVEIVAAYTVACYGPVSEPAGRARTMLGRTTWKARRRAALELLERSWVPFD